MGPSHRPPLLLTGSAVRIALGAILSKNSRCFEFNSKYNGGCCTMLFLDSLVRIEQRCGVSNGFNKCLVGTFFVLEPRLWPHKSKKPVKRSGKRAIEFPMSEEVNLASMKPFSFAVAVRIVCFASSQKEFWISTICCRCNSS